MVEVCHAVVSPSLLSHILGTACCKFQPARSGLWPPQPSPLDRRTCSTWPSLFRYDPEKLHPSPLENRCLKIIFWVLQVNLNNPTEPQSLFQCPQPRPCVTQGGWGTPTCTWLWRHLCADWFVWSTWSEAVTEVFLWNQSIYFKSSITQ